MISHLSEEQKSQIVEQYKSGKKVLDICRDWGINHHWLYRYILKEAGVEPTRRPNAPKHRHRRSGTELSDINSSAKMFDLVVGGMVVRLHFLGDISVSRANINGKRADLTLTA